MDNERARPTRKLDAWAIGIFALALIVRLLHIWFIRKSPFFDHLVVDSVDFDGRAVALLHGGWREQGVFYQAPLYPAFLAAVYSVFGHSLLAARLLQALLGSASAVLVYLVGRRCGGTYVGRVAGVFAALYAMAIHFDTEILRPALVVFLAVLCLYLLLSALDRGSAVRWGAAGLVLGLAAVARPTFLLFIPAAVVWSAVAHTPAKAARRWGRLGAPVLVAVLSLAPVAVVTAINYSRSHGEIIPVSNNGGINFYLGNNPDYDRTVGIRPGIRWDLLSTEPRVNPAIDPARWSRYYYDKAFDYIRSDPAGWAALLAKKSVLYWNGHEIERNNSFAPAAQYSPFMRFRWVSFRWLAPLAIVGLLLAWRRRAPMGLLALYLAAQMVATVAFFVCARYRMTATPALFVFAAYAAVTLAGLWSGNRRRFAAYLAVGVLAAVFVNVDAYGISKKRYSRPDYELALILRREGKTDECLRLLEAAQKAQPDDPDPYGQMGLTFLRAGRGAEGIPALEEAVRLAPLYAGTWFNLGMCRDDAGEYDRAAEAFQRALGVNPGYVEATQELARALELAERDLQASKTYFEALQKARDERERTYARMGLGRTLFRAKRYELALRYVEDDLVVNPGDVGASVLRARILHAMGRDDDAAEQAEKLRSAHPEDERVQALLDELGR